MAKPDTARAAILACLADGEKHRSEIIAACATFSPITIKNNLFHLSEAGDIERTRIAVYRIAARSTRHG